MKSASLSDVWGEHQTNLDKNEIRSNAVKRFADSNAYESLGEQSAPPSFSRNMLNIERTRNETVSNDFFIPRSAYSEEKGTVFPFQNFNVHEFDFNSILFLTSKRFYPELFITLIFYFCVFQDTILN